MICCPVNMTSNFNIVYGVHSTAFSCAILSPRLASKYADILYIFHSWMCHRAYNFCSYFSFAYQGFTAFDDAESSARDAEAPHGSIIWLRTYSWVTASTTSSNPRDDVWQDHGDAAYSRCWQTSSLHSNVRYHLSTICKLHAGHMQDWILRLYPLKNLASATRQPLQHTLFASLRHHPNVQVISRLAEVLPRWHGARDL